MNSSDPTLAPLSKDRLALIEARLARIEQHLGISAKDLFNLVAAAKTEKEPQSTIARDEALEMALGQKWFAGAGILVLAVGAAFTLTLPYPSLPSALPSMVGYMLVGLLFWIANSWQKSFDLISRYFRTAAMALLFFATLRLFYFSPNPALSISSFGGKLLLIVVTGINIAIAMRRQSPWLLMAALGMGYGTGLLLKSPWWLFMTLAALAVLNVYVWQRYRWIVVLGAGMFATYLTHALWAVDVPAQHDKPLVTEPLGSVFFLLIYGIIFGVPSLLSRGEEEEDTFGLASAFLNVTICYGLFLIHTVVAFDSAIAGSHLTGTVIFLGFAALLWIYRQSKIVCGFYALCAYVAMSVAIIKTFPSPNLFIWLAGQSLVVIATALWFRSPFIIVANFFIYVSIVLGYTYVNDHETGMSIGFGMVAMLSARILNWQQQRLLLRTELMRNAYLLVAFAVFPYALYHLVPDSWVAISWVAMSGVYYLMYGVLGNQKYRWMGHFMLMLTAFYVLGFTSAKRSPEFRILSYFVLGTVMVVISLIFTRKKPARDNGPQAVEPAPAGIKQEHLESK